jgi:hypothetical protein
MSTVPAASPVPAPAPQPAPLSQGARLIDTFVAPTKTFTDIRRSASWWLPYLVIAIITIAFTATVDKQVGFRKVVENQLQLAPKQADRLEKLTPDQRERVMQQQTNGYRYFSYGFWIFMLLWNLIIAAVLFGTFKFAVNAELKFKHSFAIVMYASLPLAIKSCLAVVFLLAGVNTDSFLLQNPVASNPGYFMNPADSHFFFAVASSIDVFMIWTLALAAIGYACVSKIKKGTALAVVFGWYLFFVLGSSGLGALTS